MKFIFCLCLLTVPLTIQGAALDTGSAPTAFSPDDLQGLSDLEREILSNYTKIEGLGALPPLQLSETGEITPVQVTVNSYVRDIGKLNKIDDGLYHWTTELTFRQKWNDKRLAYDIGGNSHLKHIYLNSYTTQRSIWRPDTFFSTAIKGDFHYVTAPNALVWVYPNGDVLYSVRLTLTLRCHRPEEDSKAGAEEMEKDLVCPVRIASWGYTNDKLVLKWEEDKPVELHKDLFVPHYTVKEVITEHVNGKTKIGTWSALNANFTFSPKN